MKQVSIMSMSMTTREKKNTAKQFLISKKQVQKGHQVPQC